MNVKSLCLQSHTGIVTNLQYLLAQEVILGRLIQKNVTLKI